MHPGPIDDSVLDRQATHRSNLVWDGTESLSLKCRRRDVALHNDRQIDQRIVPYLLQAGFYGVTRVGFFQLDWALITALVERWRPETHTFHLPQGECTITLQDVEIQFGLPVDGRAVTGSSAGNWENICQELLGVTPPAQKIKGSRLSLTWLCEEFAELPAEANDLMVRQYTRAFILQLMGGCLFTDKSSSYVHLMFLPLLRDLSITGTYSWGSAALAWLYREMCRASQSDQHEISGPLVLLQVWAWDRIPHIAPRRLLRGHDDPDVAGPLAMRWRDSFNVREVSTHVLIAYRAQIDHQQPNQMIWQSYSQDIQQQLPPYCFAGQNIWQTKSPLICFHIVEFHYPQRVARQFGFRQYIPLDCDTNARLHRYDLRGYMSQDWHLTHRGFIDHWDNRSENLFFGEPSADEVQYYDPYMVWYRNITRRFISRSEAMYEHMNHDWNSEKANLYHCYVDLDGRVTFKGPYLQQQRTHLQRVLGDENVLVVKFAGKERRENDLKQNFQHYSSVYKKLATEGLAVGLRLYQFFVFKDGGKEEKRKSPTSSPVKCYFVRIESLWAFDRDKPYILLGKPIQMARSIFMHVHKVSTISKYMPRFSLILSKTEKLEIDLGSVDIKQIDDIPCMDESGNIVYDEDGEWMIHTDGTGYISEDLALICPRNISKGHYPIPRDIQKIFDAFKLEDQHFPLEHWCSHVCPPPLLMQIRLFYNGRAIKGTLLVNRKLRPQTILIRPSMVKVEEDQCISSIHSANSLEIVGTSNLPRKATLSKHLIMHLHYGGVPRKFFLELLSNALVEAERACLDRRAALKVALRHADMDDYLAVRMILCGIPMDEPFLQFRLSVLMAEEKKGLKEGKLPISDCYYLMGTADPTGTLKSHEVCIILDKGQVSGDVLVYRNPGLHFGDVHVLTATYVKELENIVGNAKFAIFFSTQGPRSVAYEIANSDFDGDKYWVSMNKQLLCHFRPSTPWTATSFNKTKCPQMKPADYSTPEQLESKLFQLFLETRFIPSYSMSTSADSWLSFMDRLLTLGNDCEKEKQTLRDNMLKLVDIYYDALDAPKQGLKVEVPEDLRAEKYPHFLEKKYSYRSTSVLGEIFDTVNSSQTDSKKDIWKLSCFEDEVPHSMEIWWGRYLQYRKEMSKALSIESKEIKVAAANEVIQKYKRLLYDAAEFEDCTREREDVLDEALSIYHVSYDYAMQKNEVGKCSFAWNVAGQALCSLYSKRQGKGSIPCSVDVLREVMG